ncbi:unnamed protein product [Trichogramma brassicae]|uniref:Uncharacterized protein n=1 Tax=Trichogramma brassicae TaxID=86971 RepID=A0A6H5IJK2_9HYME|nr:unnamed protein product [Trichogramma brassicae]
MLLHGTRKLARPSSSSSSGGGGGGGIIITRGGRARDSTAQSAWLLRSIRVRELIRSWRLIQLSSSARRTAELRCIFSPSYSPGSFVRAGLKSQNTTAVFTVFKCFILSHDAYVLVRSEQRLYTLHSLHSQSAPPSTTIEQAVRSEQPPQSNKLNVRSRGYIHVTRSLHSQSVTPSIRVEQALVYTQHIVTLQRRTLQISSATSATYQHQLLVT